MRIIHTADWHLGQVFHDYDRTGEHNRFLAWLLETLGAEAADALLVAGDIYDHANPSAAAQKVLYSFLSEARRCYPHLNIVLVSGNHDSTARFEAPAPVLEGFGMNVLGQVPRDAGGGIDLTRLCLPLQDRAGRTVAWCLAVPFLRSGDLPTTTPAVSYPERVGRLYADLMSMVLARREAGQGLVALGHCHVEGALVTHDPERPIVVGGVDALERNMFDPRLAYVALGHLHRAQEVGTPHIRYSGSPMPLSFSEVDYPHQVVRVDLDGEDLDEVRAIPVPCFARLLRLPDLPAGLETVVSMLRSHDFEESEGGLRPYLEVLVQLDGPTPGLRARIEEALANKPVHLAKITSSYAATPKGVEERQVPSADALVYRLVSGDHRSGASPARNARISRSTSAGFEMKM
jgi:exonuclease SbcD